MQTEKQKAASKRNHLIMRLRGTYQLFRTIQNTEGMQVVENILLDLGAESEEDRNTRFYKELNKD